MTVKKKKKSALGWAHAMLSSLLLGANAMVIVLLLACGLCSYVSPAKMPMFGLFCLAYPVLMVGNLLFIPVWLVVHPRYLLLPLIGALMTSTFTQSYCPVHLFGNKNDDVKGVRLRVLTFNPHGFANMEVEDTATYTLFDVMRRDTIDIMCMQEANIGGARKDKLDKEAEAYGLKPVAAFRSNLIYSRMPCVSCDTLQMPTLGTNFTIACQLVAPSGDTIVVVSAYLESFSLKPAEIEQYRDAIKSMSADTARHTGKTLVKTMMPKIKMHGPQIDFIMSYIEPKVQAGTPVILCGDFNDTPVSYACQKARSVLTDVYRTAGMGTGFTYHEKALPFRIDHIFASEHFKPIAAQVETSVWESDHYPVTAILEFAAKKGGETD